MYNTSLIVISKIIM